MSLSTFTETIPPNLLRTLKSTNDTVARTPVLDKISTKNREFQKGFVQVMNKMTLHLIASYSTSPNQYTHSVHAFQWHIQITTLKRYFKWELIIK